MENLETEDVAYLLINWLQVCINFDGRFLHDDGMHQLLSH